MEAIRTILFLLLLMPGTLVNGQITIMSYNIRYDNPADGPNNWHERKADVTRLLKHYQPQVFGVQEGLVHQLEYIDEQMPGYTYIGVGRDDGKRKGEFAAIFFDSTRYDLLEGSTFWLSDTPDTISVGWDASMERICTYGKFRDKFSGRNILVFNAHYDHVGQQSRVKASQLILSKISKLNTSEAPVVLLGDLNCLPDSQPIKTLTSDLRDAGQKIFGPKGTFNSFDPGHPLDQRIDYIFVSQLRIMRYEHINDRRQDNLWISDHLPVLVKAEYY